jgi:CheY-specific phosphatase CheX
MLSAVEELFQGAVGAPPASRANSLPPDDIIAGTIGFGGSEMRGAITLVATDATWRRLGPLACVGDVDSDPMLHDMVRELANMLAGRFRNALLRKGVEILIAMPVSTRGSDLDVHPGGGGDVHWRTFDTEAGGFRLRLDLSFEESFEFEGREAAVVDTNEQELVLF